MSKKRDYIYIGFGILFAITTMIPYFVLGENSIVTYHDQLDGEIITYLLNAKYLFKDMSYYPEVMNGISVNGMMSPSPAFILLFYFFKPFTAFVIGKLFISLISVVFSYLLLNRITDNSKVSIVCAVFFTLIPFYTVYGLCIPGLPMLTYGVLLLSDKKKRWIGYILAGVYAINSSLPLSGFAVILVIGIVCIYTLIKKKKILWYFLSLLEIIALYCLLNISLVKQLLGLGDEFTSHKSEIVHQGVNFFRGFADTFFNGMSYAESYQKFYVAIIFIAFIIAIKTKNGKGKILAVALLSNVCISIFVAFYNSPFITNIKNASDGILKQFNFSRIGWLMPFFWLIALASACEILICEIGKLNKLKFKKFAGFVVLFVSVFPALLFAGLNNDLRNNAVKLLKGNDYYMMTWKQFYAEDLFAEINELIGLDKESYRVVSYGIYPAAATYNGFYCLDAYSNNYDVNYKHDFRRIIQSELDESDYLESWFDNWGNRCYIIQSETSNYFTFEKRWTPYQNRLDLDLTALKNMGCHYIISASYIIDAEDCGLTLMNKNEQPIQSEGSWYRLWVYRF